MLTPPSSLPFPPLQANPFVFPLYVPHRRSRWHLASRDFQFRFLSALLREPRALAGAENYRKTRVSAPAETQGPHTPVRWSESFLTTQVSTAHRLAKEEGFDGSMGGVRDRSSRLELMLLCTIVWGPSRVAG
ncbi:hypothetical protein M427DRAFT_73851 [Gonapodya prolifera JEL478]|uniref:Uncharacterized protein n=1 Tax=Gonapodya prolifera (strain JEL478) TaxID=1344416 RepID=A0A139A1R4_GONPJ|nr:hypothetical protein M427DRAFT_73851 [Gonapodya prolifera JEL478]|eukprot:KXS10578.1 hypothetical protein M427DRAFT_73851 [Gonapodya prolifera JEL478]